MVAKRISKSLAYQMAFFGKFRFQSSPEEVELYWKSFERYLLMLIVSYERQKDENFQKQQFYCSKFSTQIPLPTQFVL